MLKNRSRLFTLVLVFGLTIFCSNLNAQTLHLKPDAAAGVDAYLDQQTGGTNYGNHTDYSAISWVCSPNCNARGVLRFNLSSIPSNAFVSSAKLSLFANPNPVSLNPPPMQGANSSVLQRITSNWSETTVTWNSAPTTTTANQVTLAQSTSVFQDYLNIDVKSLVQDMVNNPANSFGFMLRLVNEVPSAVMTFCSSDYGDPTKRPEITITYSLISNATLNRNVFCAGSPTTVNFLTNAIYAPNNSFTAQLSNSSGDFSNPVNIGSVNSTVATSIPVVIPANTPFGNGYRIRVVSTNPVNIGGDNGTDINVPNTSDNNLCTIDACDPATGIVSHTPVNIDDNNACTADACDPLTGQITNSIIQNPNDNNACTIDGCNPATGIVFHNVINVDDNNACTFDGCNFQSGVFHNMVNIDDGNSCTIDACNALNGNISHTQVNINDGNACTIDGCDNSTGVYHNPVVTDDQNACTTDACDQNTGVVSHTTINSNDNNVCTFDGCDFITGVFHISPVIDDQNACTTDACDPATGQISHTFINIDDRNGCTTDGCDYVTGEYHIPVTIDDNNACTSDACDVTTGIVTHTVINTNDNNLCTFDGCDFITGVFHISTNTDDGNPCTADVCSPASGIITHEPVNIDDNNLCTIDGCDPVTGVFHNTFAFDDFNPCTEDGCDPQTGVYYIDRSPVPVITFDSIPCFGGQTCVTVVVHGGQQPYSGDGVFCNYMSGTWPFEISDAAGCIVSESVQIPQPDKLIVNINSSPASCGVNNGSVEAIVTGGTMSYSYLWSPGLQTTAMVNGLPGGNYTVVVTDDHSCTSSMSSSVAVIGNVPAAPAAIAGPSGACRSQTGVVYSVASVPGAISYVWSLPAGAIGSSTTNMITLSFSNSFSGGFLCVKAVNACGGSSLTCRNVTRITAKPGSIAQMSGLSTVCVPSVATYCIPSIINATNYIWSIGGNGGSAPLTIISGQGTNCITVNVPVGYNGNQEIKVKGENCMGVSGTRKKDIHKSSVPHAPGNISGPATACKSQSLAYSIGSVSGATSYLWSATNGASILSGQGTRNVIVNYNGSLSSNDSVSVVAINACGNSPASSLSVNVISNCKTGAETTNNGVIAKNEISFFPNPSNGIFTISVNSSDDQNVFISVMDLTGRKVYALNSKIITGHNSLEMNLAFLPKGLYLVNVNGEKTGSNSHRIVIE